MVLKLQSITGVEAVSEKDVVAALKGYAEAFKSFVADHAFQAK